MLRSVRAAGRTFIMMLAALTLSACLDSTAPDSPGSDVRDTPPSSVTFDEDICGEGGECVECTEDDKTNPESPCYEGPEDPGETCEGPQCSGSNSVEFTSTAPDSAVVGGTYQPIAVGFWETQGYPAILSSLTPAVCPMSSGVLTFIAAGTCTVAADQPGDFDVPAALQVTQSFEVYSATWPFTGFFAPLSNSPNPNTATAGSAIPVKFSLGGDRGLDILVVGSPSSEEIECPSGSATSAATGTTSRNDKTLSYDVLADVYMYVWSTDKSWKGTCRRLTVALVDGSSHSVTVAFR